MARRLRTENENRQHRVVVPPNSIGLAWPPRYDAHNQRIIGSYPLIVDTIPSALKLAQEIDRALQSKVSRLTVRAIFEVPFGIHAHPRLDEYWDMVNAFNRRLNAINQRARIEASVPFGCYIDPYCRNFNVIYVGCNSLERRATETIRDAEIVDIERISRKFGPTTASAAYPRLKWEGIVTEQLRYPTADDISRILWLYRRAFQKYHFPINEESVETIEKHSIITLVARNRLKEIVALLVAEHANLPLGCADINLIKLGEAVTDRKYRKLDREDTLVNLLTVLYHKMSELLRKRYSQNGTVIYSETRAPWGPVNIATRSAGFEYCGMLSQHCTIVSDRSPEMQCGGKMRYNGNLEDFAVWVH